MHQGRLRLRPWLEEQIDSGRYPGVVWLDEVSSAALNSYLLIQEDTPITFQHLEFQLILEQSWICTDVEEKGEEP